MEADVYYASASTMDVEVESEPRASEVIERVSEILGYDVTANEADGYRELADESLHLAESNLAAAYTAVSRID